MSLALLIPLFLCLNPFGESELRRPVVILTDCGCCYDDEWAIAHLLLAKDVVDVRGILTSHAPDLASPAAERSAEAVRRLVEKLGVEPAPVVVVGASERLVDRATPRPSAASKWLLEQSKSFDAKHRLTLALLGPATDLASALLIDPSLSDRVEVVATAFQRWPEGGDSYNVKNDPAAWRVLLESRTPLTIVDQTLTTRRLALSRDDLRERFGRTCGEGGRALVHLSTGWLDRNPALAKKLSGSSDALAIWDEGAAATILGFSKIERRPRPRLREDLSFAVETTQEKIGWVVAIDSERTWLDLRRRLAVSASKPSGNQERLTQPKSSADDAD